ncbi:MAG: HAMP domain-containing histidine kinase [Lachnospiraceae bacterium]|nr:HAMP domain-containing histidine kinase [Lachnospiraceae bacterium]
MKRKRNKFCLVYMLVLFAVLGILYYVQIRNEQKHEAENVNMVYQMLGELQKGVSYEQVAADVLKGNENQDALEEGLRILAEYGYDKDYHSVFSKGTNAYAKKLAVFYLMIYLLFLVWGYIFLRLIKKNREAEYQKLGNILERFHNGEYDFLAENMKEELESSVYMRLESLGKKLELNEQRMAVEKEETKALVTDLSHQLKTPVASIKMCFQLLEDENLQPEERKEFLNRLGEQILHLEGLLEALVNISRMETGMIEIRKEMTGIFNTVVQAVNQVYMKAEDKGIEIVIDTDNGEIENLSLAHDVKWTKEAVVNVLENAVKYSPADSTIEIIMKKQLHFLRIEIRDEGIGIKKEEINRIFQRFYRGKHEVIRQAEGSGVGLYLARKILEEQGGNITVALPVGNKQVKGSTFAIMLPLKSGGVPSSKAENY